MKNERDNNQQLLDEIERLKKSEGKFREIFQNTLNCIVIYEPVDNGKDFVFIDFNSMAEKTECISKEKVIKRKVTEVFPKIKEFGLLKIFQNVCKTGKAEYFPMTHYKDERLAGYRENYVYKLSSGHIIAIYQDVTEKKQTEEKLQAQADFIDNLIENSALSTWISDDKGTLIRANPACLEFFGTTEDEVVGKYNLFKDEVLTQNGFIPQLKKVFEEGIVAHITIDYDFGKVNHISVKNSTHKMVKSIITPIIDENNKVTNAICQAVDLTDLLQTKDALEKSEVHYRQLFNSLQCGAEIIDKNGVVIQCNPSSLQMLGYEKDEMVGKCITSFIDEKAKETFKQNFPKLLQGESASFEICMIHKNGHKVHILRSAQPVLNTKEEVENILVISIDITKRRQNELELEKHRTNLEAMVLERTKELEEKNSKLDAAIKVFVGRELKIKELRKKFSLFTKRDF